MQRLETTNRSMANILKILVSLTF
uniref:Uncharacterized protein n=1 Tax=Arundo donax TaxID=35708 RepID=A0A0A9B1N8_ARUDO